MELIGTQHLEGYYLLPGDAFFRGLRTVMAKSDKGTWFRLWNVMLVR